MLYDYIIIYYYKTEGKKERKKRKKERNITACHWLALPLKYIFEPYLPQNVL